MKFVQPLIPGTLIRRYKRFLADIRLEDGEIITAHCPNSGSMRSCNIPGSRVMLSHHNNPKRKYAHTWEMVQVNDVWVGINTMLPNRLVTESIEQNGIPELASYEKIIQEKKVGDHSRLDLMLEKEGERCFVEIKNVTLVENGRAMFPDAVTVRGTKHLNELITLKEQGHRAVIFFLIQRQDGGVFSPAEHIDPVYAKTLRCAHEKGVEILPYQAMVSPTEIKIIRKVGYHIK